jgi:hypothetical protein
MKKMMLMLGAVIAFTGMLMTGCSMLSDSSGTSETGTNAQIESLLNSALSAAATVLQNDGVQAAAVAAAEAYVAQSVDDPDQAAVYNSVIEAAVPALADSIGSLASSGTDTAATETKSAKVKFQDTAAFQSIVAAAVDNYQKKTAK